FSVHLSSVHSFPTRRSSDLEELDTRFSKFSPFNVEDIDLDIPEYPFSSSLPRADDILSLFSDHSEKDSDDLKDLIHEEKNPTLEATNNLYRIYSFSNLDEVSAASRVVADFYTGDSSLYKDIKQNRYYLVIHKSDMEPEVFNRICNILSEYGTKEQQASATEAYYKEHFDCILPSNAITVMKDL